MSNDNPSVTLGEKILHYFLMGFMALVLVLSGVAAYVFIQKPTANAIDSTPPVVEPVGEKKPLPDYMIDNIENDELELLKP